MDEIVQKLLSEVKRVYSENQTLTDDLLSALHFVFKTPLLPALDLVDRRSVSLLTSPSGRQLYRVSGSSGIPYICFVNNSYCECPAYRFSVLKKGDFIMCKHVLAAKLSAAMNVCVTRDISDEHLSAILKAMN